MMWRVVDEARYEARGGGCLVVVAQWQSGLVPRLFFRTGGRKIFPPRAKKQSGHETTSQVSWVQFPATPAFSPQNIFLFQHLEEKTAQHVFSSDGKKFRSTPN